jgi:hypothetical protein
VGGGGRAVGTLPCDRVRVFVGGCAHMCAGVYVLAEPTDTPVPVVPWLCARVRVCLCRPATSLFCTGATTAPCAFPVTTPGSCTCGLPRATRPPRGQSALTPQGGDLPAPPPPSPPPHTHTPACVRALRPPRPGKGGQFACNLPSSPPQPRARRTYLQPVSAPPAACTLGGKLVGRAQRAPCGRIQAEAHLRLTWLRTHVCGFERGKCECKGAWRALGRA